MQKDTSSSAVGTAADLPLATHTVTHVQIYQRAALVVLVILFLFFALTGARVHVYTWSEFNARMARIT
jgi:hypothetical protein